MKTTINKATRQPALLGIGSTFKNPENGNVYTVTAVHPGYMKYSLVNQYDVNCRMTFENAHKMAGVDNTPAPALVMPKQIRFAEFLQLSNRQRAEYLGLALQSNSGGTNIFNGDTIIASFTPDDRMGAKYYLIGYAQAKKQEGIFAE